jgi:2-C-methyl-D-erythritol 4-phosphate cytidylyltransferase / 2-C-methyl-D-erythritol 2,4-cyclodiphosphate synthase
MKPIFRWSRRPRLRLFKLPLPPQALPPANSYWLVMPAAGGGHRFGGELPKQYASLCGRTVIEWSLASFLADSRCVGVMVALAEGDQQFATLGISGHPLLRRVEGGAQRSDSVLAALLAIEAPNDTCILVHDAARPCVSMAEIDLLLAASANSEAGGLLALPVADTLKRAGHDDRVGETTPRELLWRALTPQLFPLGVLRKALQQAALAGRVPTDEAQAVEWLGLSPQLVTGSARNIKITERSDLALAQALMASGESAMTFRTGTGIDVHAFGPGNALMLGGVLVPHTHGVIAHSDGDVLIHALCDALLGAAALGDIGQHFPDSDAKWKGVDSGQFLVAVREMLTARGYVLVNADLTLLAEQPRIGPHRAAICTRLAQLLQVQVDQINLKATTTERLGFLGRGEGLGALVTVLIRQSGSGVAVP